MPGADGDGRLVPGSAREPAADAWHGMAAAPAIGNRGWTQVDPDPGATIGPDTAHLRTNGPFHAQSTALPATASEPVPHHPSASDPASDPSPALAPPPRPSPRPVPAPHTPPVEPDGPQPTSVSAAVPSSSARSHDDADREAAEPSRPFADSGADGSGTGHPATPQGPGLYIEHDFDDVQGHRTLRLRPTLAQWQDFPAVLAFAGTLGVQGHGCFKVSIPDGLHDALPHKPAKRVPANAYKVRQIRKTAFWQVRTVPSDGELSGSKAGPDFAGSVDSAFKALKRLFWSNRDRQMRRVRYRVDVHAWTPRQRLEAGVPERSPIHPLKGDKLDGTRAIIPGIHTPYVYESGPHFGATFQIHAEDFRLASLNHLYRGRKIWVVVPATAVDTAERALGRGQGCSQFMRHRAEFFFPDKLEKLGIPYHLVDQRPGETIVILPDAYHEGFSTGYTIAEAKNYAGPGWNTDSYQPCQRGCRLATAIPAALMRLLAEGEERLDLCAAYGDEGIVAPRQSLGKRPLPDVGDRPLAPAGADPDEDRQAGAAEALTEERDVKRTKAQGDQDETAGLGPGQAVFS